jgi:hypothetical protein
MKRRNFYMDPKEGADAEETVEGSADATNGEAVNEESTGTETTGEGTE